MNSVTISWKLRLFMKVFKFMVFDCKIIMSLNTVPTNYHEFEYSKFSVFKLKFMTTGRIHAERWCLHGVLYAPVSALSGGVGV
jgi:hypothetical protein